MKKRWYRLTLDVAYEGYNILDRDGNPVTDEAQAKKVLTRVVKHDVDVAFRMTPSGPVDWDLVDAGPLPWEKNVFVEDFDESKRGQEGFCPNCQGDGVTQGCEQCLPPRRG